MRVGPDRRGFSRILEHHSKINGSVGGQGCSPLHCCDIHTCPFIGLEELQGVVELLPCDFGASAGFLVAAFCCCSTSLGRLECLKNVFSLSVRKIFVGVQRVRGV